MNIDTFVSIDDETLAEVQGGGSGAPPPPVGFAAVGAGLDAIAGALGGPLLGLFGPPPPPPAGAPVPPPPRPW